MPAKRPQAAVADRLTALAKRLCLENKVLLTNAMCAIGTDARVWLRLGERGGWLHPFGNGKDNAVTSALRGELREYLRRLDHPTHEAPKFMRVLEDKLREATAAPRACSYLAASACSNVTPWRSLCSRTKDEESGGAWK